MKHVRLAIILVPILLSITLSACSTRNVERCTIEKMESSKRNFFDSWILVEHVSSDCNGSITVGDSGVASFGAVNIGIEVANRKERISAQERKALELVSSTILVNGWLEREIKIVVLESTGVNSRWDETKWYVITVFTGKDKNILFPTRSGFLPKNPSVENLRDAVSCSMSLYESGAPLLTPESFGINEIEGNAIDYFGTEVCEDAWELVFGNTDGLEDLMIVDSRE